MSEKREEGSCPRKNATAAFRFSIANRRLPSLLFASLSLFSLTFTLARVPPTLDVAAAPKRDEVDAARSSDDANEDDEDEDADADEATERDAEKTAAPPFPPPATPAGPPLAMRSASSRRASRRTTAVAEPRMVLFLEGGAKEKRRRRKKKVIVATDHSLVLPLRERREKFQAHGSPTTPPLSLRPINYTLFQDGRRPAPQAAGPARDQDDAQRRGAAPGPAHRLQLAADSCWLRTRCGARRGGVRDAVRYRVCARGTWCTAAAGE